MNYNSLFFRFSFTLIVTTLAFQTLTMLLIGVLLIRPLVQANVADLTNIVELSVNVWQATPSGERTAKARELSRRYRLDVGPVQSLPPGEATWLPLLLNLENRLQAVYHQPIKIRHVGDNYRFVLQHRGEALQVLLPDSRLTTRPLQAMLAIAVGAVLVSFAAAYFCARHLMKPVSDATRAAARVGRRELPQLPVPKGADELVELAESFNRMAQEVDSLINNRTILLAGVSHDLRSPLARLRLAVELARDTRDWNLLDDMLRHIEAMSALLHDYLEFAQGAAAGGQTTIKLHEEGAALLHDYAPRLKVPGMPLRFKGNRIGLVRILRNTIENALRYSGEAPVELNWSATPQRIEITIDDRGPGLPRAARDLLQPFVRGDLSRNLSTGGVGLGLAVCRMIAHAQGWEFSIDNRDGGGVRVRLSLPRKPA